MILSFSEYLAPVTFKSGKTGPARWKAGGTDYLAAKGVTLVVGGSYDCIVDTTHSPDGKFTNHTIKSAVLVTAPPTTSSGSIQDIISATAPESAPKTSTPSSEAVKVAASPLPYRDTRSDEINRQSARRDAVSLVVAGVFPADQLWPLAEKLAAWTYFKEESKTESIHTSSGDITVSRAQAALETARKTQADIRSTYRDEDAVCAACGRKEFLKQWSGGWFCARSKVDGEPGGCGAPPKGERMDSPATYGEWKAAKTATSVPWKD